MPRSVSGCAVSYDPSQRHEFLKPDDSQATPPREINSQELMQGHREIVIRHGTEAYRLSVTRAGKLILRK